ncbi:MAG: hypothetical protein OXF88_02920 [Rhodobacteraceae bacterium]|nr:hypothetical protein [Paracoccaceae bacterium]
MKKKPVSFSMNEQDIRVMDAIRSGRNILGLDDRMQSRSEVIRVACMRYLSDVIREMENKAIREGSSAAAKEFRKTGDATSALETVGIPARGAASKKMLDKWLETIGAAANEGDPE